jgi:hypothetical protein
MRLAVFRWVCPEAICRPPDTLRPKGAKRFEVGYTHDFQDEGEIRLGPLWQNGFEIFNGKVILVPEHRKKNKLIPVISVGFIAWSGGCNVEDYLIYNNATNNARITATSTSLGQSN